MTGLQRNSFDAVDLWHKRHLAMLDAIEAQLIAATTAVRREAEMARRGIVVERRHPWEDDDLADLARRAGL